MGFWSRTPHVPRANLVPATLLGRVQRLVRAVDELRVKGRLLSRGDAHADGQLEAARECCRRDLGGVACREPAGARLRRLGQDQRELFTAVPRADVGLA